MRSRFSTRPTPNIRSSRVPALAGVSRDHAHTANHRHSRESGNPGFGELRGWMSSSWMPRHAFTPRSEASAYALARGSLARRLKVRFRLDGGSLSCQQPQESNQRRAAPESAPSHRKRRSATRGCPALLARGGFYPQAIHGLWVKSSASCLAPRLRAGLFAADSDARRSQTGRNIKSGEAKAKPQEAACATLWLPKLTANKPVWVEDYMFAIRVLPPTQLGPDGERLGEISIGDFTEHFACYESPLPLDQTELQWKHELQKLLAGEQAVALQHDPRLAWIVYRTGSRCYIQQRFSPTGDFSNLLPRRTVSEDGDRISEWAIDLSAIERFTDA